MWEEQELLFQADVRPVHVERVSQWSLREPAARIGGFDQCDDGCCYYDSIVSDGRVVVRFKASSDLTEIGHERVKGGEISSLVYRLFIDSFIHLQYTPYLSKIFILHLVNVSS